LRPDSRCHRWNFRSGNSASPLSPIRGCGREERRSRESQWREGSCAHLDWTDGAHCTIGLRAHQAGRLLRLSSHLGLVNFLWTVHPVSSASCKQIATHPVSSTRALWASVGGITEGPLCTTQAIMIQIGGYGTAVFSAVIAIHTFSVIVLQKTSPKSVAICVIALGWSIPIGVDLLQYSSALVLFHFMDWLNIGAGSVQSLLPSRLCVCAHRFSSDSTRVSHTTGATPLPPDSPVSFHICHLLFLTILRRSGQFTH
jgi:hypothetical protein